MIFAAIVLMGLPFAVWAGWHLAGVASAPGETPSGAGGLGVAPGGDRPARVRETPPTPPIGSPTATPTASTPTTVPSMPPTGTASPLPTVSPSAAPEATVDPTPAPTDPPTPPPVTPTP
ncbi:hypothetical protein WEI85_08435 [Actinomycetes bacterium KLBMP 9797]